jgi:hypothetical protein
MLPPRIDHVIRREKILADSLRDVATDLRLIDLTDLVVYLKTTQFLSASILVQSSSDLSFKRDTLRFGQSGDVELDWHSRPKVSLDMEFHNRSVHVYFRLILETEKAGVEISYVSFENAAADPEVNTCRLADALFEARVNKNDDAGLSEI